MTVVKLISPMLPKQTVGKFNPCEDASQMNGFDTNILPNRMGGTGCACALCRMYLDKIGR
jgi:hypothetical protein